MKVRYKKYMLFLVFFAVILSFFTQNYNLVLASNINIDGVYSDVLEDLQKSADFNKDTYSFIESDYSLNVIQVAESTDRRLFVYVYQPCANSKNLKASSLNLSTSVGDEVDYYNYDLEFINSNDVFFKYLVKNFVVSTYITRNYEITSIYRAWDSSIDESIEDVNGNVINEVVFKVGKIFTITGFGSDIEYKTSDIETIKVTSKYVGFVRYPGGIYAYKTSCDSHFVAFSTDKPIDKLYEADICYMQQSVTEIYGVGAKTNFHEPIKRYAYPTYSDSGVYDAPGLFGGYYNWDRISTVEDFISTVNSENMFCCGVFNVGTQSKMTEDGLRDLRDKQWVISFAETEYATVESQYQIYNYYSIISNVTILRLKFETNGVTYNLGVIDNKQTGDGIPDNETKVAIELADWIKYVFRLLLLILCIIVLSPILPIVFNVIWIVFKLILKIVVFVFTIPIKLLKKIFKKGSDKN